MIRPSDLQALADQTLSEEGIPVNEYTRKAFFFGWDASELGLAWREAAAVAPKDWSFDLGPGAADGWWVVDCWQWDSDGPQVVATASGESEAEALRNLAKRLQETAS